MEVMKKKLIVVENRSLFKFYSLKRLCCNEIEK